MATTVPARPAASSATFRRPPRHHRVLILGGGTAGLTVAARLRRAGVKDIALFEPSRQHYYQPLWTLVGAGLVRPEATVRPEASYIPRDVRWIQEAAVEIDPDGRRLTGSSGLRVGYDFLVVAPGIQVDWDGIPGLREALRTPHVSSNYAYELTSKTWQLIRDFRGGTALFTNPGTPIKCPGAAQKIMYLAAERFRRSGLTADVVFGHAGAVILGVKEFAEVLLRVIDRYGIDVHYQRELVELRPDRREAIFEIKSDPRGGRETIPYDLLHVVPPMSAPQVVKRSPLAVTDSPLGWAKVDKYTLQSPDYPEVFALGDAAGTPNAKTGAAIRKQAPVVVANLRSIMQGAEPTRRYDGYASCPLVTAHNRMVLAEFDYDLKPAPSIPFLDTNRERYDMFLLKRYGLPWMYWHLMLRGRA